jgi:hypothetical protein
MARMTERCNYLESLASLFPACERTLLAKVNRAVPPACGGGGGVDRKAHAVIVGTVRAQPPFGSPST